MTIKEVAELADVSNAAVSRYLNGGYLAEDKRERIREAIRETGYTPSAQARALRTGSTRTVGVVVPKINSESVSRITAGIGQVLRERGYQMLLASTDNHAERELEYLDLFQNHPVDGIVLAATIVTPRHRAWLKAARVPVVVVGQRVRGANCVYHDDAGAARDLARVVVGLARERADARRAGEGPALERAGRGAEDPASSAPSAAPASPTAPASPADPVPRIAYIGVTREDRAVGRARADGFVSGLESMGVALPGELVHESDFSLEGGYRAASDLLGGASSRDRIDFISCATDTIAAGAIRAITERFGGLDAPGAPGVSGFGDNAFLAAVTGGIPTVHFGYLTSGIKATQMLMGIIDGDTTVGMQLELGYRLVHCRERS